MRRRCSVREKLRPAPWGLEPRAAGLSRLRTTSTGLAMLRSTSVSPVASAAYPLQAGVAPLPCRNSPSRRKTKLCSFQKRSPASARAASAVAWWMALWLALVQRRTSWSVSR